MYKKMETMSGYRNPVTGEIVTKAGVGWYWDDDQTGVFPDSGFDGRIGPLILPVIIFAVVGLLLLIGG